MAAVVLGVLGLTSAFLFAYGANVLYLSLRAARATPPPTHPPIPDPPPHVLVQLPVYNERYVATRVLDAAASLDWPRPRLTIQVLDDSDDETTELIAAAVARWRAHGVDVRHVRRHGREGYKAGALAHGLMLSRAPFVAVFDADFVPPATSSGAPSRPSRRPGSGSSRPGGATSTGPTPCSPGCRR